MGLTVTVSVSTSGGASNGPSAAKALSNDGRFVAFGSAASNLVAGDTNAAWDAFLHDRDTDADGVFDEAGAILTERVSVGAGGAQGNSHSATYFGGARVPIAVSEDGRYLAFNSDASNLVAGDSNLFRDLFVRDRLLGTTQRVDLAYDGAQSNGLSDNVAISDNGRFVAFQSFSNVLVPSDTNGFADVFVRDRVAATTTRVSVATLGTQGDQSSHLMALSSNGRFVVFESAAGTLVPADNNALADVFLHDRVTGATTRSSVSSSGVQGNSFTANVGGAVSLDGGCIAFTSYASNLVTGDTNGVSDVFVHDRAPATTAAYCTAKTNSQGCVPLITASGTPSDSSPAPFTVGAQQVINNRNGLLFYGFGPNFAPFQGGQMCVAPPIDRTSVQSSGGNATPTDCSGSFAFDFNAHAQSGADPVLVPGTVVYCQYWYRDPASASTTGLTDALVFEIGM
jgi:Tol biopolymer transport system component